MLIMYKTMFAYFYNVIIIKIINIKCAYDVTHRTEHKYLCVMLNLHLSRFYFSIFLHVYECTQVFVFYFKPKKNLMNSNVI